MCGIAGITHTGHLSADLKTVMPAMIRQLNHRGPDAEGFIYLSHVAFAHSRLSIIDLEGGGQPMASQNGRFHLTFNGEIFNYLELRRELTGLGYSFSTQSDTETILVAYQAWGVDCLIRFNGQFAFALWDEVEKQLLLARDPVGICPLYFYQQGDSLLFASEIKALLPAIKNSLTIDSNSLDAIFTFWAKTPGRSIFKDIHEVKPGYFLQIKNGQIQSRQYWDFNFPENFDSFDRRNEADLVSELKDRLISATKIRLRADVPVGAYLSGGLDSSVLASLINDYGDCSLRTFSLQFSEKALDESSYQQDLIQHINTKHSSEYIDPGVISENFHNCLWHIESPVLRTAPVPMGRLSRLVHNQNYRVVLTGEGADEILGGYDLFKETKIRRFWSKKPDSSWRPLLLKKLYPYLNLPSSGQATYLKNFFGEALEETNSPFFSHLPRWQTTSKAKMFFSDRVKSEVGSSTLAQFQQQLPERFNKWHWFNQAQYLECKTLMAGYLLSSQGDRMLAMNSVEGRFPYLDPELIEFAGKLPPKLKMKVLNEKYLLKQAMLKRIPASIINRYKQPYRAPDVLALTQPKIPEWIEFLLSTSEIQRMDYFNAKSVSLLVKKARSERKLTNAESQALVGILSTQVIHHLFIDQKYSYNKELP